MRREHVHVGLGFMFGRAVTPKLPAFFVLQSFLGMRPPLPFRDALLKCIRDNNFRIWDESKKDPEEILHLLETYVIPSEDFVLLGAIWDPEEAASKRSCFRGSSTLRAVQFFWGSSPCVQ
jgi:hypothetical protein